MKKAWVCLQFSALVFLTSCSSNYALYQREKEFGTKGKNKWVFHRLSDRDKGTTLAFPGYIVAIEKAYRKRIGAPSRKELRKGNGFEKFGFNESNGWNQLHKKKKKVLNDPKTMFISSIHEFQIKADAPERIDILAMYDAYDTDHLAQSNNAYEKGFEVLDSFRKELSNTIPQNEISHVFLFSMGWNSDQQEAIRNFNSLFLKILDQADKSGKDFRPMFIGITWPSHWSQNFTNLMSFGNKAYDSDEIGMTWANYLLNRTIQPLKEEHGFKTIVFGHSFGARLTSRAVMSASMLNGDTVPVDLLINLQSAYSINRYSESKGLEATSDYVEWGNHSENIALICSKNDKAVTKACYAPYAGGIKSYNRVIRNKRGHYKDFVAVDYNEGRSTFTAENQLLLINASPIVKKRAYRKGGRAHSDIYNKEVAELLWDLIVAKSY